MHIQEFDAAGKVVRAFDVTNGGVRPADRISTPAGRQRRLNGLAGFAPTACLGGLSRHVQAKLFDAFMPSGYPESVSEDYLAYQIYDSLQAFSSSIAGLLASRAVLEGFGVGDAHASATSAVLLSVVQDTFSRLVTIAFASRCGTALEPEAKRFRLLADVVNDFAMLCDTASPLLPRPARVPALCMSGGLRAVCGVAAGGSKAALSQHFAQGRRSPDGSPRPKGNVGELNAKDSSQETVISLLGMLAGSFVVPLITKPNQIWACLLALLALHLFTNYKAVRAIVMRSLNRQRANIVFSSLIASQGGARVLTPGEVASGERIFERDGTLRFNNRLVGFARLGVDFSTFASTLEATDPSIGDIDAVFSGRPYWVWFRDDGSARRVHICLRVGAGPRDILQAWATALQLAASTRDTMPKIGAVQEAVQAVDRLADGGKLFERLEVAGWDVDSQAMETGGAIRIECQERAGETKKNA